MDLYVVKEMFVDYLRLQNIAVFCGCRSVKKLAIEGSV